jgi:protoporphyrinogen oxidase
MERHSIIVIGAGPAGLAAAYELSNRGAAPVVLEKGDRPGGLARTEVYQGYRFDIGGHRFYTRNAYIRQVWRDMLGDDLIEVNRQSRIYYRNRFFNYPLSIPNTVSNLGIAESALIMLSYLKARLRPSRVEETFDQWVSNRFGPRLYRTFFKTYTEKVWGVPCEAIRADWAVQRIGGLSVMTALRNALFGTNGVTSLIDRFHYPVLGPGMMWERFATVAESAGASVRLEAEVVRLDHEAGRMRAVAVRDGVGTVDMPVEAVISSMPLSELVLKLRPQPPREVLDAARALRYRDFVLVSLVVDRRDVFSDNWIYVHSPSVRVGRVQNFKNWSAAMVPDQSKTCLGMEYFCSKGDDLWTLDDARLVSLASTELASLGFAHGHDVEGARVVRQEKAYPVYDGDYHASVATLKSYLAGFENVQSVGRSGMHRYNNQDHSMLSGLLAARNVLGERHELWNVNTEQTYSEAAPQPS